MSGAAAFLLGLVATVSSTSTPQLAVEVVGPEASASDGKPFGPEAYELRRDASGAISVRASDERGALYGRYDVEDALAAGRKVEEIEVAPKGGVHRPKLTHRQFKLNLPLSGTGYLSGEALQHNAWFWDEKYWDDFLDLLSRSRFNVLSLWSAHPYPQMVRLEKYPEVQDLTKEQLDKNVALFHSICSKAKARGIDVMLVTWNCHVSPSFAKAHEMNDSGADTPLVREYMKECVRALLAEYPEIRWLGTCPGEAMPQDAKGREEFIRDTYVAGITASGRKDVRFMHRYWGADPVAVGDVLAPACKDAQVPLAVSIKFNGEHMYSSPTPHFFDPRWTESTASAPRKWDVIWHLRNDDLFTLRWGDPEFARATLASCAKDGIGFLTGSEVWIDGADYIHSDAAKSHMTWKWDFDRLWLRYAVWGRLGYDPTTPDSAFEELFAARFGRDAAHDLFVATEAASRLPPLLTSFHWNYMNGDWYPEGCVGSWVTGPEFQRGRNLRLNDSIFHDVREFVFNHTIEEKYLSVPEWVACRIANKEVEKGRFTPLDVATKMESDALESEKAAARFDRAKASGALACTLLDLDCDIELARYYAEKIRGAAHLGLHFAGIEGEQEQAVAALQRAQQHWTKLAAIGDAHWREHEVWLMGPFSWGRYAGEVARDVELARKAKADPAGLRRCGAFALPFDVLFDFNSIGAQLDLGIAPFDPPPPVQLAESTTWIESEDFAGSWREQTNYPGFRGRGFRCSNTLGSVATTSLRRRVLATTASKYAIWVRGLVGHATDQQAERSIQAFIDGTGLTATQTAVGCEPSFVWEKAGEVELGAGVHELELRDHGHGYEHPDAVAISRDPAFDPSRSVQLPPFVKDGPARFRAAIDALLARAVAMQEPKGPLAVPATAEACRARQTELRSSFLRAIGLEQLPERTPLNMRTTGTIDLGDIEVEKIVFESRPKFYVTAHVWKPKGAGPFPGILVPVGHWMDPGKLAVPMQGFGQALARSGYVALIYDPIDQGERRGPGMSHRLALPLFTAGQCDLTYLLWDSIRGLDVLEQRADVDKTKLGVSGCSGGGMNTTYMAVVDPRVKAAAPCCYFSTYESIIATANHCEDNFVPAILRHGAMADVLALAAPMPLIALNATRDEIFPEPASHTAIARINEWYERLGAAPPVQLFLDDSQHDYSKPMREHAVAFFEKNLRGRADAGDAITEKWETKLVPLDDRQWRCLPDGLPADARTLAELTDEAIATALASPAAAALTPADRREHARKLLEYRELNGSVDAHASTPARNLAVETFVVLVEGFPVTAALVHGPGRSHSSQRVRVLFDDRGLRRTIEEDWGTIARLIGAEQSVLVIDPSGRGDTAEDEEHAWRVATYVGQPLLGLRVNQAAAAARTLLARIGVNRTQITLNGRGVESGLLALLTSFCADIPFGSATDTINSFKDLPARFDDHPAICVPRLLELGDVGSIRAAVASAPRGG